MTDPAATDEVTALPHRADTAWARLRRAFVDRWHDSGLEQLDIRWRFRFVVMAFGLPFLAYIVWSAAQQAVLEKEHVRDHARSSATLVAARFEDHVQQIDRLLAAIAQSVGGRTTDVAAITRLLQRMQSHVPGSVDNIGIWSVDGTSIASLDRRTLTRAVNVADRAYFREAIARRDFAFEGPIRSRASGTDIIQFARPIFDGGDQVVGVITMSIHPGRLIGELDPGGLITSSSLVSIFNDHGTIVARSTEQEAYVGRPVAELPAWMAAFEAGSGTREETGVDGQRRLEGYSVVKGSPWIVMVGEPIELVLGPVGPRLLKNLGVGLAIFALALLIAGRVAAWTSIPLKQLAADAERLGKGELSHRSRVVVGGHEIETLASNFNSMATALEERDRALATSRTQLRAIADNIPQQITYVDRDERYRFVNDFPGPFENIAPAEMIGKTVREVRGERLYEIFAPTMHRAMRGEANSDEKSMTVDGRTFHFSVTYVPDFDADHGVRGVYAFAYDITQRKTAELLLIESEKRLVTITDNVPAMICYVDEARCFRFANRAFEKWFQRPLVDIIGQSFDRMMTPEIAAQFEIHFRVGMHGLPCEWELEVPVDHAAGLRWLRCSFIPDFDGATGRVAGVYGLIHNVSKAKEAEQRLTRLAQFDTLTGLANRHQFNESFARVLSDNDRDAKPLALMFLDIDHFKQVNDRHGHASGDVLLKEFSQRLIECLRPTDVVARLSGDEFVVLLEGMHSDDEPQFIARKIIATVEKPFGFENHVVRVTASIGIAMRSRVGEPASVLMRRADEALYEAKRSGRNTFRMAALA